MVRFMIEILLRLELFRPRLICSGAVYAGTVAKRRRQLEPMDAPDGLNRQYRIPITFPALPPGAIEQETIDLMFNQGKSSADSLYRLRLHTQVRHYDYKFRLKLSVSAREKPDAT